AKKLNSNPAHKVPEIKARLKDISGKSRVVFDFISRRVALINGVKGMSKSFDLLDQLLNQQYYRLAYWKVAFEEINYRRFFDVNELAAIRIEDKDVFEYHHKMVFDLIKRGKVHGLRIDHPDGLYNPSEY